MTFLKRSAEYGAGPIVVVLAMGLLGSVQATTFDRVVAKVNTEIITLSSIQERFGAYREGLRRAGKEIPSREKMQKEILEIMVEERLQVQEAKKLGIDVDENRVLQAIDDLKTNNRITDEDFKLMLKQEDRTLEQYKSYIRDQILMSQVVRFQMGNKVKVSDQEVANYYKSHEKDYWLPPKVHARHILFINTPETSEVDKKLKESQARQVLKELKAGGDFIELAKKYSEDVSASTGGDIGIIEKGKMVPEFEKVVFQLKPGEISDLVQSRYGYHIVKVEEQIPGKPKPLDDQLKEAIKEKLFGDKSDKLYKDWVAKLKNSAFIQIHLEESKPDSDKDSGKHGTSVQAKASIPPSSGSGKTMRPKVEEQTRVSSSSMNKGNKKTDDLSILEKKLKYYKKMRDMNRMTEEEYQKKKQELLSQL